MCVVLARPDIWKHLTHTLLVPALATVTAATSCCLLFTAAPVYPANQQMYFLFGSHARAPANAPRCANTKHNHRCNGFGIACKYLPRPAIVAALWSRSGRLPVTVSQRPVRCQVLSFQRGMFPAVVCVCVCVYDITS